MRAKRAQLVFHALVAAIQMIDPLDKGFTFSGEPGNHEARRGAQIGRHDSSARQARHAAHDCGVAVDIDVCAQAQQLLHVHEAVFEDRLDDHRSAFGQRIERHQLGLHVSGKARIFVGADVDGARTLVHRGLDPVVAAGDFQARLAQLGDRGAHGVGRGAQQRDVAACSADRAQEAAGFDAVGDDAVLGAVQ